MKFIKRHKVLTAIGIILLVVIIGGVILLKRAAANAVDMFADVGATATVAEIEDMSQTISVTGSVESQHVVSVSTELTGRCTELNVALGDHVDVGQTLCTFDTEEINNQIATLEAQASQETALNAKQLQIAQRQLDEANTSRTNAINAQNATIASLQAQLDAANAAVAACDPAAEEYTGLVSTANSISAELAAAQAELASIDASTNQSIAAAQDTYDTTSLQSASDKDIATQLAKLYRQRDEATITAEIAGTVTSLNISQGAVANGTIMTIADTSALQIHTSIREKDILNMQVGLKANITTDALEGETFTGTVARVINFTSQDAAAAGAYADASSSSSSASSYSADITVDNPGNLLLGMSVKVEIIVREAGETLAVPYDAVMTDDNGNEAVMVATENGDGTYTLKKTKVVTGEKNDYFTAITDGDLKEGDLVMSSPESYEDGEELSLLDVGAAVEEALED